MGESIPALGWVMVEKTPGPHVNEMWQCGEFSQQKIIMTNKGKDETQVSTGEIKRMIVDCARWPGQMLRYTICLALRHPFPPNLG